jgi:outer membrane protein
MKYRASFIFLSGFLGTVALVSGADVPVSSSAAVVTPSSPTVEVSTFTGAPAAGTQFLTLPQCIQTAISQATTVLKAKNAFDFSGTQLAQTYMQFLPNLEANANYTYQIGRAYYTSVDPTFVNTKNHGGTYQLSSTLNLFNGFSDVSGWRSGSQRRQAARLTLFRAKQQIAFDITQAYLQVLLDRQIVRIGEINLQASREREKLIDAQTQVGSRSLADLYRQQAETSADEVSLINARARVKDDLLALLERLRLDLLTPYDITDLAWETPTSTSPYGDEGTLVRQALHQRADLEAQERLAQATRWDVTSARAGYFPQLNLFGSLAGTGSILDRQTANGVNVLPASQPSLMHQWGSEVLYDVGVNLNWGIFERYLTRLSVARAQEAASDTDIDAQDRRLQVEEDVQQALNDYDSAVQQVTAAEKGVKAAQESFDAVSERYKVGASSIVDLLTAQSALVQAQASQAQSHIDYALQKRAIDLALGTLSTQ